MKYELPNLEYAYKDLEKAIDEKTMEIHHSKHHATYIQKLNTALETHPELKDKYASLEELLMDINNIPEDIRGIIKNNGNQTYNHNLFWKTLTPNTQLPENKILELINRDFGTFEKFKEEFTTKSANIFGSGWTWLFLNKSDNLEIKTYQNEGNPLMEGTPLLPLDIWEHAYYLRYQNKRLDYINNWFDIINWKFIETLI